MVNSVGDNGGHAGRRLAKSLPSRKGWTADALEEQMLANYKRAADEQGFAQGTPPDALQNYINSIGGRGVIANMAFSQVDRSTVITTKDGVVHTFYENGVHAVSDVNTADLASSFLKDQESSPSSITERIRRQAGEHSKRERLEAIPQQVLSDEPLKRRPQQVMRGIRHLKRGESEDRGGFRDESTDPRRAIVSPATEILKTSKKETYQGQRLAEGFPRLFDTTGAEPISLAQAGLCVIAVKLEDPTEEVTGMPEHASFLGQTPISGTKSVASLFVVGMDERMAITRRLRKINDVCTEDGVFASLHSGGVNLYGPGMDFIDGLKNTEQSKVDTHHGSTFKSKIDSLYSFKRPIVDLKQGAQAISRNVDVMRLQHTPTTNAFVASVTLSPEFGSEVEDVAVWRDIVRDFVRFAEINSCIPIISGRTLTVVTNLNDPTAMERPEDVSMAWGSTVAMLRAKSANPRVTFDSRMFQAPVKISGTAGVSILEIDLNKVDTEIGELRFDGKMRVDKKVNAFSADNDSRARFVKMSTVQAEDGSFLVKGLTLIRDRVEAGQVFEFVGRENELRALEQALKDSDTQLSTRYFQGPTGAGKTAVVLRVAATHEHIAPEHRIVLAFKNKDNLDALRDLAKGLVDGIGNDAPTGLEGASVVLLKRYLLGKADPNFKYSEMEMINALAEAFKVSSDVVTQKGGKLLLVLDDFDAAGLKMQGILTGLMTLLNRNKEDFKGINIVGTVRSGQDHVVNGERQYVDGMKEALGEKVDVDEFVLRDGEGNYAPWLEEFLIKRCFAPNVPEGANIDTANLTKIGELCAMMSSKGEGVHGGEIKVPAHTLRIVVDSLNKYLALDGQAGVIRCPKFEKAKRAIESGELPRGAESIYESQVNRAKTDTPKITLLYFAEILNGVDYRVLEDPNIAEFLNAQLFPNEDGKFAQQLDKMRMKADGSSKDEAIFSADANMSMHNLWRTPVQKDMAGEMYQRSEMNVRLRKAALDALIMAKENPALAQHVKAVMIFDLAQNLGATEFAKQWALNAADEATDEHDYAKVIECAEYAYRAYEEGTENWVQAAFYLAKANLFSHNKEEGRRYMLELVTNKYIDHLPLAMRFEFVEVQLELYRQGFIDREIVRDKVGMKTAMQQWGGAINGMKMFVERKFSSDMGDEAVEAGELAKLMIRHSELEHKYKSIVSGDNNGDTDQQFQELIDATEVFLMNLKDAKPSEQIDIMVAKVSQALSAQLHQKWRQLVGFDEVVIAQMIETDEHLKADMFRVVELCNNTLLIARQRKSLGGDYSVEARAATARFTAGAFLNLPRHQQAYFISIAVQYMANVSASDAENNMGNMYCGASAALSRADIPEDAFRELLQFATEIARIQGPEENDNSTVYRYYNYIESKLFQAVSMQQVDAEKELREIYGVLDRMLDLAQGLDFDSKLLVLLLVSRHLATCEAKDVSTTQEGVPFNHIGLIRERIPNFRELIMQANERFDGLESQGDDSIQLNLYNGVDDFDASQISSIHDLIVKYGAKSAFELLLTRDVQAE